jgi:lipopolysaccharide transport protein LptA
MKRTLVYILMLLCAGVCNPVHISADTVSSADKETAEESGFRKSFASGSDSQAPLFIKSDTLTLDSKDRIFTYKGNVRVLRDALEITTDVMIGRYAENQDLESILCVGNVVITKGEDMRATSNRAFYNVVTSRIELTDEPELARDGNILAADKIIIFVDEDRSEAEGNVRVKVIKSDESGSGGGRMKGIINKQPDAKE